MDLINANPNEHFATVEGYSNYLISDAGRCYSIKTQRCIGVPRGNYTRVTLYPIKKSFDVHELVMNAFGPPKPGPDYEIDHKNNKLPLNNHISNLRWTTHSENMRNQSAHNGITYQYVDKLPPGTLEVCTYKDFEFDRLFYFDGLFYYYNGVSYRILLIHETNGSKYVNVFDIKNERRRIFYGQLSKAIMV